MTRPQRPLMPVLKDVTSYETPLVRVPLLDSFA
jgi:hypothetical protein